ncbi:hypothetical protein FGRMN_6850 [Fusarium graminum]|nr:hypothetical protein FGRMN_6850 [Fusarium graminum]
MVAFQHMNFRLQGIPLEYETRNEVCRLVQKTLGLEPSASPTVYSLALSPVDQDSKIATISFPAIPESLSNRSGTEWSFPLPDGDDIDLSRYLVFDTHFVGFTPFQRSSDEDCNIDVVVVCGLGGHALGSFKEKNGRFVWIRDALPSKIPHARILTYGYNTQLADSRSFQNLTDLGRALKIDLEGIHNPDQPRSILFIGHSLGGLVIKETVLALKEESFDGGSSLLEGIFGFAFFGVPHQGLAVECLVPMVKDNLNRQLLESLHRNSSLLERLQIEFDKISQARKFYILAFYETEKSRTAAWVGGKWEMSGPSEVLVEVFSATCGCRRQFPINRNHSEMVKYSGVHDQLYQRVITALLTLLNITQGQSRDEGTGGRPQALVRISGDERDQQLRYGSYEQKDGWRWTEKELEKFLFKLLTKGTQDQPVVIFIDALDECGGDHARSLLESLRDLMASAEKEKVLLKICFSSRHFPILGHEMMPRVYVEEKNDKDIRLIVEDRLKELQPDERRQRIENEIFLKAQGGFQWAILVTGIIRDKDAIGSRTGDLLSMISFIPPQLDRLYDFILDGATEDEHKQTKKLFQWVLFAERPLSAQELREALSTDKDMTCTTVLQLRSHKDWSDNVTKFETRVRHISRGLVEFQDRDVYEQYEPGGEEWNREAQFIHQSAADFVAQKFFTPVDKSSKTMSSERSGNYEISRSFLRYLTLEEILHGGELSREKLSTKFPLMPYGVSFVLRHIRAVEAEGILQNDLIELIQWYQPQRLKLLATIWRIMDPECTHAPRGWPFAGATVMHAVKDTLDLTHSDSEGNTVLHLALRENHEDMALMILGRSKIWQNEHDAGSSTVSENEMMETTDYLAYVNVFNNDDETCLTLAVSLRADRVIQCLFDAGAEIRYEKCLLFYAISTENMTLLCKLIEVGADLAGAVFFTIQCLHRSGRSADILHELLGALLDAGADTKRFEGYGIDGFGLDEADESDDEDEEAIFLAIRHGMVYETRLLTSDPSSVTRQNSMGEIPLITALRMDTGTARVLLQAAPETVLWKDEDGETILDKVTEFDLYDTEALGIMQLLVAESGGHLTSQQIFWYLVERADPCLLQEFLTVFESPVPLVEPTEYEPHLLSEAVRRNFTEAVSFLLRGSRIDMRDRDYNGDTTLHIAVSEHNIEMARLLLARDTEKVFNSQQDTKGYTPLSLAIMMNNQAMARLILDSHYDSKDFQLVAFQTILSWTITNGSPMMVEFLLRNYTSGENCQMPFWCAIRKGCAYTAQLFLELTNIDIHERNKDHRTALCLALESGSNLIIQLLIKAEEFDMNKEDVETIRELGIWARAHGEENTVGLYLESSNFSTPEGVGRLWEYWLCGR